jgi:predicted nucleic acid-binding protein
VITAVDTSVLLDVFLDDERFGSMSANALRQCLNEGSLVASEIVWAETAAAFPDQGLFQLTMKELGVKFSPMFEPAALQSAAAWAQYRKKGGDRQRIISDFLVGAHAKAQCDRLLTRDRGFFRDYFAGLTVLDPIQQR